MTVTRELRDDRPMVAIAEDRWRTSVPATFALAFGLTALLASAVPELAVVAVVVALVAVLCGTIGMIQGTRPGVTGRSVAITGMVLAVVALLLSGPTAAGLNWFVSTDSALLVTLSR